MSYSIIIADASVLITLFRIGRLELLNNLYTEIYITPIVRDKYGNPIPDWIKIKDLDQDKFKRVLKNKIDKGEASSIALALQFKNALLIIDEKKGRKIARLLNLNVIGLLGIIIAAKEIKIIESVSDILIELEHAEFWISESLKETVLRLANEY